MSGPSTPAVAVLGLGAMGSRVAQRLGGAGHELRLWNRTRVPAATAATPAEAVAGAAVVLVCVRDDAASREVWAAAAPALGADAVAVELSTVTPQLARELGERLGARFLAAPMVGSLPQVEGGLLQLLVGGEAATLDRCRPVLEAIAGGVHHVGAPADAALLKLVVNGLLALQLAGLGELLEVLRRSGVDEQTATGLLAGLPVTSAAVGRALPRILGRETAPAFPIGLARKDVDYLLAQPGTGGVLRSVGDAVAAADRAGRGGWDVAGLAMPA